MNSFDVYKMPLNSVKLIEASAGTGKTWTLTRLFLRLIVEKELPIESILVMTFTKAATHELRSRIRSVLTTALEKSDPDINTYLDTIGADKARLRIRIALHRFDFAAIHTIHAFAASVLASFALESGQPVGLSISDKHEYESLLETACADFWRREIATLPVEWLAFLGNTTPEIFSVMFKCISSSTELHPVLPQEEQYWNTTLVNCNNTLSHFKKVWQSEKEKLIAYLTTPKNLDGRRIKKQTLLNAIDEANKLAGLKTLLDPKINTELLSRLTTTFLSTALAASNPVLIKFDTFTLIEKIIECLNLLRSRIIAIKFKSINSIKSSLAEIKRSRNKADYDDLLFNVHIGLSNYVLKKALLDKYKAALIDEFQDTDPVQYKITESLFGTFERPLVLIGDPKQAIYRFRGADLFTYLATTKKINESSKFTITENFRSHKKLVDGVNSLFNTVRRPGVFLLEGLDYRTIVKPEKSAENKDTFTINGNDCCGITLLEFETEPDKVAPIVESRKKIIAATAYQIASLLNSNTLCNSRPIAPEDIAVLTRTNKEAILVKKALYSIGVPSVTDAESDLFLSAEATEFLLFLRAAFYYNNRNDFQPFLLTAWGGYSADHLISLSNHGNMYTQLLNRMQKVKSLWENKGLCSAFEYYDKETDLRKRLSSLEDGERILTNINHLLDVLSEQEIENNYSPLALISFLQNEINPEFPTRKVHQLRLESDENAVIIQTIHRSKGLEYPVTFCPFLWTKEKNVSPPYLYHDDTGNTILDLDSASVDSKRHSEQESLAESVRLLYVALTRAKYAAYVVFGNIRESDKSALNHLLFGTPVNENWSLASQKLAELKTSINITALRNPIQNNIDSFQQSQASPYCYNPRHFSRIISNSFSVTSFTKLLHSGDAPSHSPDNPWDEDRTDTVTKFSVSSTVPSFPCGKNAGSALHLFLESIDFNEQINDNLSKKASDALSKYGIQPSYSDALVSIVKSVLETNIIESIPDFSLANLRPNNKIVELQFHLPVEELAPELINSTIPLSSELNFSLITGYLHGFIDLVFMHDNQFFIIDWKSNYLGASPSDYSTTEISKAVLKNNYTLQYHIYTLALHRFLQTKIPDYSYSSHFGGVIYLFVRGVSQATKWNNGVYFCKPDLDTISKFDTAFQKGSIVS